jgi:hypothetical protein
MAVFVRIRIDSDHKVIAFLDHVDGAVVARDRDGIYVDRRKGENLIYSARLTTASTKPRGGAAHVVDAADPQQAAPRQEDRAPKVSGSSRSYCSVSQAPCSASPEWCGRR